MSTSRMSTITRRFTVTAARETRTGVETIRLGRATEWDSEGILIELDALPCGNWWDGTATLREEGTAGDERPWRGRNFDLVAGKSASEAGGKKKWIRVGTASDTDGGAIRIEFNTTPAGNWWDGKLRLFVQDPDGRKSRAKGT
jgi:hypothetical protein